MRFLRCLAGWQGCHLLATLSGISTFRPASAPTRCLLL